jgi:hypothetical protein
VIQNNLLTWRRELGKQMHDLPFPHGYQLKFLRRLGVIAHGSRMKPGTSDRAINWLLHVTSNPSPSPDAQATKHIMCKYVHKRRFSVQGSARCLTGLKGSRCNGKKYTDIYSNIFRTIEQVKQLPYVYLLKVARVTAVICMPGGFKQFQEDGVTTKDFRHCTWLNSVLKPKIIFLSTAKNIFISLNKQNKLHSL